MDDKVKKVGKFFRLNAELNTKVTVAIKEKISLTSLIESLLEQWLSEQKNEKKI